jgi:hypothetical protein
MDTRFYSKNIKKNSVGTSRLGGKNDTKTYFLGINYEVLIGLNLLKIGSIGGSL